jgi:hypothetical protein
MRSGEALEKERQGADIGRWIDWLVDGELTEAERRALLLRLDGESDGWRRCALAFLEDQCLRVVLAKPSGSAAAPGRLQLTPTQCLSPFRTFARTAAAAFVAFALGWAARGDGHARPEEPPVAGREVQKPRATAPRIDPVSTATVIPSVLTRRDDREPAALTTQELAWERKGYQVERGRRFVSVDLGGGRRADVPVDEVRLRFVGDRTY